MANKKISELTQTTTVGDADLLPVVQSSVTKQITKKNFQESLNVVGDVDILKSITSLSNTSAGFSEVSSGINNDTFRLTHDGSITEFGETTLTITNKFQGKVLNLFADIATTAASGNFKVVITDESNGSEVLADEIRYCFEVTSDITTNTTVFTIASGLKPINAVQHSGSNLWYITSGSTSSTGDAAFFYYDDTNGNINSVIRGTWKIGTGTRFCLEYTKV